MIIELSENEIDNVLDAAYKSGAMSAVEILWMLVHKIENKIDLQEEVARAESEAGWDSNP